MSPTVSRAAPELSAQEGERIQAQNVSDNSAIRVVFHG
jgi:hypothetical protein